MRTKAFLIISIALFSCANNLPKGLSSTSMTIKVMTWNIWGRMNLDSKYTINGKTARTRVIEIIKDSGADIIGMIETYGSAAEIAKALNYHYYTPSPDANLTIFSRYPLKNMGVVNGLSGFSFISATIVLPNKQNVRFYDIWLTSGGRHIVEIKKTEVSDADFNKGDENRYEHLQQLLQNKDFQSDLAKKDSIPLIVVGDFNCVSHLDYTEDTKKKGLNFGRILTNKTSLAMEKSGFTDTYRTANPIITTENLGYTWTTVGQDYKYVSEEGFVPVGDENPNPEYRTPYARIDFIYCSGNKIRTISSKTITHHASNSQRSFPEFPSDHGAVISTLEIF